MKTNKTEEEVLQQGNFEVVTFENVLISESDLFKMKKSDFEDAKVYVMVDNNTTMFGSAVAYCNDMFMFIPTIACSPAHWEDGTNINYFFRAIIDGMMKDDLLSHCGITYHEDELRDPLSVTYVTEHKRLHQRCKQINYRLRKLINNIDQKAPEKQISNKKLLDRNPIYVMEQML